MNTDRFANVLGEDYNLFKKSLPDYDSFQDKIGDIVKKYTSSINRDTILVVEGGTGTGLTAYRILNADKRIKVIGIDNEEKLLKQARVVLAEYGDRIELKHKDLLEALKDITSESADVFASAWVIHNLTSDYRVKLFPEIARVLKKGGLFVNVDKYAQDDLVLHNQDLNKQIKAFEVFDEIKRPDLKKEWTKHYDEDNKIKFTEKEQMDFLKEQRFTNIISSDRKVMDTIFTAIKE